MVTTDHPAAKSRWWQRVIPAILTAGALAGAVTAIISFWPTAPVDVEDKAIFTSGRVIAPQRLSTFDPTSTIGPLNADSTLRRPAAVHVGLVAAQVTASAQAYAELATELLTAATPTDEGTPPPGSETPTTTDQPTTTPSPLGTASILEISPDERHRLLQDMLKQPALDGYDLPKLPAENADDDQIVEVPLTVGETLGSDGKPLSPKRAAAKLAAKLDAGRSVQHKGRRDPVGALVTFNLELDGLRGRPLLLYWRMFRVDGSLPPKGWRKLTLAYRLTPGTEHDTANFDMWVPLPRARGPYTVDLILATEGKGARLAGYSTHRFD